MRVLKGILKWISSIFFHLSLFGLIGVICFYSVLGSSDKLKNTVYASGAYDKFVDSIIEANSDQFKNQSNSLPLDDPAIQNIVKSVFTPKILKDKTESVIDGFYEWFDGDVDELKFEVDLSSQKNDLIDKLSTYAALRLDGLETCTQQELQTNNLFELDCQPPGFYREIVKNQVTSDLENSDFLRNPVFTEDDLPRTEDEKSIVDKLSFVPLVYKILNNGIWIFGSIFVLASFLFIIIRRPLRKGAKAIGKDLLGNGSMLIIFTVFYSYVLPKISGSFNLQLTNTGSESLDEVSNYFVHKLDILIINIAIQIAAVGLLILIIERMSRTSNIYAELAKKTGMTSSIAKESKQKQDVSVARPPLQTSEASKKPKSAKKISTKRKITL